MLKTRMTQTAAHLVITALGQLASTGLGVFTGVVTARLLGPQGRGELAALTLWPMLLVLLATMGINQAVVFYTGKGVYGVSEIWTASQFIGACQSLAIILVGVLAIPLALKHYPAPVKHLSLVFLASIPLIMLGGYPVNVLQGRLRMGSFNVTRTVPSCAYAIGLIVLFAFRKASLLGVVACQIAANATALVSCHWALLRTVRLRFAWEPRALFDLLRYGWKTQFGNISDYVNRSCDQLLLSLFVAPHELGLYAVAVSMVSGVLFVPQAAAAVTLAAGSNAQPTGASRVVARLFRTSLVWLIITCSALFLGAHWLVLFVFGPSFARSAVAARILLPGMVAVGLNQVLYDGARALGDPALPSYAQGFAGGITLLGLFLALPRFGFIGAAWVSTVAYTATLAAMLILYRWRLRFQVKTLLGTLPTPCVPS